MRVFRIAGEVKALFYLCLVYLCALVGFDSVSMSHVGTSLLDKTLDMFLPLFCTNPITFLSRDVNIYSDNSLIFKNSDTNFPDCDIQNQ